MTNLDKAPLFCDTARAETLANQQASSDKGRPMREILEHHLIETLGIRKRATSGSSSWMILLMVMLSAGVHLIEHCIIC